MVTRPGCRRYPLLMCLSDSQAHAQNTALRGWTVWVPRAKEQAGAMSTLLSTYGAHVQSLPTIAIEPVTGAQRAAIHDALAEVIAGKYEWVVFSSANAVRTLHTAVNTLPTSDAEHANTALLRLNVAVVGAKTAAVAREYGYDPTVIAPRQAYNAEGVVAALGVAADGSSRVFLPRADIATPQLREGLRELGWQVTDLVAYHTVLAPEPSDEVRALFHHVQPAAICFTSASTVRNMLALMGDIPQQAIIACIGPKTQQAAQEAGLVVSVVPEVASAEHLVEALVHYVAQRDYCADEGGE
ncbi:uroporphyrinogen-III synthase [Corynebacterium sp. sy039]|nr:uroporphyrinogen-III synthase [Corynebacterium sp. sy039]